MHDRHKPVERTTRDNVQARHGPFLTITSFAALSTLLSGLGSNEGA